MDEPERVPTVIASHVDLTYRVFGAGRGRRPPPARTPLSRWISRGTRHMGMREVHAVKDVSFVAYRGESIGLVGRNGSGKSTLLRAVAGLIPPTSGEIYLNGEARLLGVNAVLLRKLTGARNIMIGGQALGLSRAEVRERYRDIVRFADIGEFINLPMSSYSSGMAARLRFAISTATVPDILVVDEALATGDVQFRARANERIKEIRQAAGTVFLVSHNSATIKQQCTRALWMDAGHLVMDGPAGDVVDAYAKKYGAKAKKAPPPKATTPPKAAGPPKADTPPKMSTPPKTDIPPQQPTAPPEGGATQTGEGTGAGT